jgi:RNA polymerase sigma-70 factor, ECF subfamily
MQGRLMRDDAELARSSAAGDREAAGEIYDRYAPLVRAILVDATGSLTEANDLVQEVFLRALAGLAQLRQPELLGGWLVGIARRQGIEHRRARARQRSRFGPLVDDPQQDNHDAAGDEVDLVRQAISELPEQERLAVHIHYLCGEPVETARAVLKLSPSGFYKLLDRARGRLRARLLKLEEKK